MKSGEVFFRLYEELNIFIPEEKKKRRFSVKFCCGDTVKTLIEELGIPHTEVDLILANGNSVPFSYKLQDQDKISVFPVFESFDITGLSRLRLQPLRKTKFILDSHLGTLARHLRMLGFDTLYSNSYSDETLSQISRRDKRIVLTRNKGLLKRKIITRGYCIQSKNTEEQLHEVMRRFDLHS